MPASEHTARFYDTDETRAKSVAAFLAEGYERGQVLIVLARPRLWAEIQSELIALGVPVDAAITQKRLVVRDAAELLNKISNHDGPSAALFDSNIGALVRSAGRGGLVRAYGAMVDILAQQGEFDMAVRLEQLWNGLVHRVPVKLLCGYTSAHFVSAGTEHALCAICAAHDQVHMQPQDQLGSWLLGNAGIQPVLG